MPAAKRSSANAEPKILRTGNLRIKKNGVLSWSWKVRSVTLTDKELATPNFKIPLDRITKLERVDVKPYCLLLQTADRRYLLSFENDSDLYDWQEDVYSRCPLIGAGNPFGFQHNAHMGVDAQTGAFHSTGVPSQWLQPLGISPSDVPQDKENANPKAQTTKKHHRRDSSQAGASTLQESTPTLPYKPTMKTIPIAEKVLEPSTLSGTHQMRVAGRVVGWSWKSRYFVLGPKTLKVSRTEGSKPTLVLNLRDITNIDRTDLTDYCLMLEIKSSTQYFISFKHADDLYNWQDDLYSKSPLAGISGPTNFVHHVHIGYDAAVRAFTGMPEQWRPLLDGTDKVRLPTSVAPAPIAVR